MKSLERRGLILARHGAGGAVREELLDFNAPSPILPRAPGEPSFPLPDEPHLKAWRLYAGEAKQIGTWPALRKRFAQLQFPVRSGMSKDDSYRRATRRGRLPAPGEVGRGLALRDPQGLELLLGPSIAGTVPILVPADRSDFVLLVQAFTARNEPDAVPGSMGACLVSGLNNWDRIHTYREEWKAADPGAHTDEAWAEEFRRLVARKKLYQDRFLILSRGRYSNVDAQDLGTDPDRWLEESFCIRREHECTHYFTLRVFGRLGHNVLEELLADLVGIVDTYGRYDPDLALRFLGLEGFPTCRAGGRLENYRGSLSDEAFAVLAKLVHQAVGNLARVFVSCGDCGPDRKILARLVFQLTPLSLEELAAEDLFARLAEGSLGGA